MHLQGLATSLEYALATRQTDKVVDLPGVFQRLRKPPSCFIVYLDLRRGAEDGADIAVRLRKARGKRAVLFDSGPQLVLAYEPLIQLPIEIEDVELPGSGMVIEVLIDGRVAGSRVVQSGDEELVENKDDQEPWGDIPRARVGA